MKKKLLIAIVDKDMDSEHSFIKNFLITKQKFFKVILLCETLSSNKIFKSNNNYILPILKKRKFLNRLYNFCRIFLFLKQYKKENKNIKINVLVRNDPIALLAVSLISSSKDNIIFQSSFPHELGNKLKGFFQNLIFYYLRNIKINLMSVSDLGLKRLKHFFINHNEKMVLPLFSDFKYKAKKYKKNKFFYISYIGAHDKIRQLKFVIESIILFLEKNKESKKFRTEKIKFLFIGSSSNQKVELIKLTKNYRKNFVFIKKLKKKRINDYLNISDVGISLIPPLKIYRESCPTKIIEYISCKIPIIANHEIPFQKKILKKNIGYSVSWNQVSISKGFENILSDKKFNIKKKNAFKFYKKNFYPLKYQKEFYKTILQ